jgi:hypothetical protein
VGARVYKTAAQSLSNGISAAINFDAERFDTDGFHDNVTANNKLTIPSGMGGKYLIGGGLDFASNTTGKRAILIKLNNTTFIVNAECDASGGSRKVACATLYDLAAADFLECFGFQSSGGNLNVEANAATSPEFWLMKVG